MGDLMGTRKFRRAGPLTQFTDTLRASVPRRRDGEPKERESASADEVTDFTALLARYMDLPASVRLAQKIATIPSVDVPKGAGAAPNAGGMIVAHVRDRVRELEEAISRACTLAVKRRTNTLAPDQMYGIVQENGLLVARDEAVMARTCQSAWEPFRFFFERQVERLSFEIDDIRNEIGPVIAAMGRRAAKLERLDAAMVEVVTEARAAWVQTITALMFEAFAANYDAAVRALTEGSTLSDIVAWYEPGGWVADHFLLQEKALHAILTHSHKFVSGLVSSAIEAGAASELSSSRIAVWS